jgi:hypothetical protein
MAEVIVQPVQVLDEEIAPAGRIAKQPLYFFQRAGVHRPALGNGPRFTFHETAIIGQPRAADS